MTSEGLLELGEVCRRGRRRDRSCDGEVTVEARGDDAQQQPTARRRAYDAGVCGREPVIDERVQPLERGCEICSEVDPVAPLDRPNVDLAAAHQLLNRIGTQQIVGAELQPACHG